MLPADFWRETASAIARRAKSSRDRRSFSERDGILGLFVAFHHTQLAALLDTIVELAPKFQKVLSSGYQRADHYQPEEVEPELIQQRMLLLPRSGNQDSYGAHLQNHFGFAQQRCRDRKSFRRCDVPQTKHSEFTPDDDDNHPSRDEMHIHKRNERGRDEQFVRDGI